MECGLKYSCHLVLGAWSQKVKRKEGKLLSRVQLYDSMDCSLPGSSIHGTFQARVLEWVATSFSRGSSRPRNWTPVSHIADRWFTLWATMEAPSLAQDGFYASFYFSVSKFSFIIYIIPVCTELIWFSPANLFQVNLNLRPARRT